MMLFRRTHKRTFLDWQGYLAGIGLVAIITALKIWLQPTIIPPINSYPYILAIVPTAIYFGLGSAIITSLIALISYEFFFFKPLYTIGIVLSDELWSLLIFLIVGIIISLLTSNIRYKNEESKRLNKELITSQEDERKRIARDLHDDTSPMLAYLSLELDAIVVKTPDISKDNATRLADIREKLTNVQQDIRRFSHELHPAILDNLGLESALETLAAESNSKIDIEVEFVVSGEPKKLNDEANLALYRITQEALNNVFKHSKASKAVVNLEYGVSTTQLSIMDNGVGFNQTASTGGGLGLTSIQERANLIGAKAKIDSAVGRGTIISIKVASKIV